MYHWKQLKNSNKKVFSQIKFEKTSNANMLFIQIDVWSCLYTPIYSFSLKQQKSPIETHTQPATNT